jgi:hypothetical protein
LPSDTFHVQRSTEDTYVRSSPHSNADNSCDHPLPTLRKRMLYASTARIPALSGIVLAGKV